MIFINPLRRLSALFLATLCTLLSSLLSHAQGVTVNLDAGRGVNPFFATENGTAANGLTLRMGTFNSASDADIQALGYNLLWVNNQFTIMDPIGGTTTGTADGQAGSFNSNGSTYADWFTDEAAALNRSIWLVYSNDGALSSSTQFGVVSSTNSEWDMPASYDPATLRTLTSAQTTTTAFGSTNGTTSTSSIRTAAAPTNNLYWDAGHPGLGGTGTWSTTSTTWTTNASGVADAGPYAWGTTSGTSYYAGAGLTAYFGGTAGTVTVSGTVQAHDGLQFETAGYTISSGTINLAGSTAAANTLTSTTGTTTLASVLTGSSGMTKDGSGTLRLDAANTYTGITTINDGTLQANLANALQSTSSITVNSGGSLLVSASNAVNNSAGIILDGGTIAISGTTTETLGALTLNSNSIIDLSNASGARSLSFANSNAIDWSGTLSIWNWNGTNQYGTSYGSGDRQIFFGSNASGLTESQLNSISFYSDSGSSFIGTAFIRADGEIAAVPEPEVYATALLLLLGLGIHLHRQRRRCPL